MPLRLRFDRRAESDLDEIHAWVAPRGGYAVATACVNRIIARCEKLLDAPRGGRIRRQGRPVIRSAPFERSALIYYRVGRAELVVIRILRRGRDPDVVLRRR